MIDRNKVVNPPSVPKEIFDIIQFKFKHSKSSIEQQIITFQKNYYKQYSAAEQTAFISQANEASVKEALINIGFRVPYDFSIISTVKQTVTTNSQNITDVLIFATLNQGLSYLVSTEKPQNSTSDLFFIFPLLLASNQHRSKIITTFILILNEFSISSQNVVTEEIHNSILSFLKKCEELPSTFSEAFFSYFSKLSKDRNQKLKLIGDLFDFTQQLIVFKKISNSIFDNETFLTAIKPFIFKLHIKAISLLHTIAVASNDLNKNVKHLFVVMAKGLSNKIKLKDIEYKSIFIEQKLTEFPALRDFCEITYNTEFKKMTDFQYNKDEIKNLLEFEYDETFKISSKLTPQYIQYYLSFISSCLIGINDKYVNAFLKRIIKSAEKSNHLPFYADYFSVIVFFADIINNLDERIIQFLMSTIIFHSSKFLSFYPDSKSMYYYLQYSVFQLIIKQENSRNQLIKVLLNFASQMSPFIYSEILLFLLNKLDLFENLSVFCTEKQIESFMNVSVKLQKLYGKKGIDFESCKLARIICFHFLFKLFDDLNSFLIVSSIQNFSKGIANFIFEPSLSNIIIDKLENTFSKIDLNLTLLPFFTIIPIFTNIIEKCTFAINDTEYNNLGKKIIKSIINVINAKPKFVSVFYPNLYYILNFFKASQEKDFLNDVFHFLLLSINDIDNLEITYDIFETLVEILTKILTEKSEITDKIQLNFFNLLSGKELNSVDQLFIINNSQIIPLFITSFSKYSKFDEILLFFSNICQYSQSNCVACHDGDLDYFLIHFMKKELKFTYNGHQVEFNFDIQQNYSMVFNIISQIIRVKTSVFICDQIFQMLIPSSPSYQAYDVLLNLNLIQNVINENLQQFKPTYNLITNKTLCKIIGFKDKHLNNNFAFTFWLKIDVQQIKEIPDEYTLALFEGVDNVQYKIYLKSNYLNIKISNDTNEMTNTKKKEIPKNKWVLVSFIQKKIEQEKPEFLIYYYVDNKLIDQLRATIFQFNPGNVSIILGTSKSSSKKYSNLKIGEIGPFCFSQTIDLETISKNDKNFERNEFYFSSSQRINTENQKELKVFGLNNEISKTNLNDIIIEYYDLNYLTYIYSKFQTDNYDHLTIFLDIILSLLSSSKLAQYNYRSVLFLEQTIAKLFGSKLNYDLFLKLALKFEELSNQKLINEFFDSIIFNMNLWCMADTSSIIKIIDYLKSDSDGYLSPLFQHSCSISKLLTIYRLSFFPELTTNEISEDEIIYPFYLYHKPHELKLIKEEFFQFIVKKDKALSCQDIQTIYSHLFASRNRSEKIDILRILSHFNYSIKSMKSIQFDIISPLFKLLNSNDLTIIISTIMTIKNISFEKVHMYFSIISISLSQYSNVPSLFDRLLLEAETEADLYSLICSLALLLGKNKIAPAVNLIQKICSNDSNCHIAIDENCMWAVWPICIALRGSFDQKAIVADFLCKQVIRFGDLINNFINIYCLIELLAQNDKSSAYETQNLFTLNCLYKIFNTNRADIELHKLDFLTISYITTFFNSQSNQTRNRPLINLFLKSHFREAFLKSKQNDETNDEANNNVESIQYRPRNFDEFYYSWSSCKNKNDLFFMKKYANDYSGIKKKNENIYISDYRTQSDETKMNKFSYLFGSDKEDDDENENESGNKKPCKSFRDLLNIVQSIHIDSNNNKNKNSLVFSMKIIDEKKWIDFDLCNAIVTYSNQFFEKNSDLCQSDIFNLIEKFKNVISYMKNRNPRNNLKLFVFLEENVAEIQKKLTEKINPDKLYKLLGEAINNSVAVMKYDNSNLFNIVDETYINNFECEINRINNSKLELFECVHLIHKKFIRCRDSSIFINGNDKTSIEDNIGNKNINNNEDINKANDILNNNKISDDNKNNDNDNENNENNIDIDEADIKNTYKYKENDDGYTRNYDILNFIDKNRKFIYKRDNCLCYGFCPIKIRPKYIFENNEVKLLNTEKILQKVGIEIQSKIDHIESSSSLLGESNTEEESPQNITDFKCKIIKINCELPGKLCFLDKQISIMLINSNKIIDIYYRLIRNIFRRKRYQRDTAVEIVLINGKSYLIDFEKQNLSSIFFSKIRVINFPLSKTKIFDLPIDFIEKHQKITSLWENGIISNFSYLLTLNTISGRSFNDVTQYPIFPVIIESIKSTTSTKTSDSYISRSQSEIIISDSFNEIKSQQQNISLLLTSSSSSDSEIENDNSKTINYNSKNYNFIMRDLTKNTKSNDVDDFKLDLINLEIDSMFNPSPLPPDLIDRLMMRIEPFTSLHLIKQNHKIIEKSIFSGIESINKEKCELIPEFYFFPEFLMNLNELPISNFSFPNCFESNLQNPFEFIYWHRKMLESKKVSENLNAWIDLIFGIKQHEFNYHPYIFEEIWNMKSSSLSTAEEKIKSMMNLFGVMPPQLFVRPHSKRSNSPNLATLLIQSTKEASILEHQTKFANLKDNKRLQSFSSSLPYRRHSIESQKKPIKKSSEFQRNYSSFNLTLNSFKSFDFSDENFFEKKEIFKHNIKLDASIHLACSSPQNEEFFIIDKEGNVFSIQIMMNKIDHFESQEQIDEKAKNFWKSVTHLCMIENGLVIASSSSDDIFVENRMNKTCLKNMNKDVDLIVSCQNYFVVIQNKTIISLFDTISPYPDGQIFSIEATVVDCKIDQSFGLIVFLCSNDVLHFHSIQNMCKLNAVDLKKVHPRKILISQKWGFVLVACLNRILIFDVNGLFIKSVDFKFNINYWNCIRSFKDFDFVVFESDKEEIGLFEAFNPIQTMQILTHVNSKVCSIDFFQDQNCIGVLTIQGELIIVSSSLSG